MTVPNTNRIERAGKDLTGSLLELFKRLIADGVLSPGDRLPPERELAEMVGVSRSSLRQALKVLENIGVISQRVGSGTRLNPGAASILAEPLQFLILLDGITFGELMEARLIVEPTLAARAAKRAAAEDIESLRGAIRRMEENAADLDQFVVSDVEFHQAIHRAAGNRVCTMLFSVVHQSLEEMVRFTTALTEPERTLRFHRRILAAIRRRDEEAASERMREHLEDVVRLLARAEDSRARTSLEGRIDGLRPVR